MPRARLISPSVKKTIHLPADVATRLDLYLLSPILGRIPEGAYQKFFVERINEFFEKISAPKEPS